jgi:hypothetical protein
MDAGAGGGQDFRRSALTIVVGEARYTESANRVIGALRAQRYQVRVKNYWALHDEAYQGINLKLTTPGGQHVELQLHTELSLNVKEGAMHKLYEEYRALPDEDQRRKALDAKMFALGASIPVPPGAGTIR